MTHKFDLALLPKDYRAFCQKGTGISAFHGYYRLLGCSGHSPYTLEEWNDVSTWRFAWPQLKKSYVSIGFSAWGDQYMFDLENPLKGIFFLEAYEMASEPLAETFTEFLNGEWARLSENPYDERMISSFERFGSLRHDEGLALVPPLLLASSESQCDVMRMDMRALLIANGDIFTQMRSLPPHSQVTGVQPYTDEKGRARVRLKLE